MRTSESSQKNSRNSDDSLSAAKAAAAMWLGAILLIVLTTSALGQKAGFEFRGMRTGMTEPQIRSVLDGLREPGTSPAECLFFGGRRKDVHGLPYKQFPRAQRRLCSNHEFGRCGVLHHLLL